MRDKFIGDRKHIFKIEIIYRVKENAVKVYKVNRISHKGVGDK